VLANRYGKFTEAEFHASSRPGTVYLARAGRAAMGVQRLWRFYWPITLARRFRSARLFQTLVRKWLARRRWWPIIRFRCKFGMRKMKKEMFALYVYNVKRNKRIKFLLHVATYGWSDKCFKHWVTHTALVKQDKMDRALLCLRRIRMHMVHKCVQVWRAYAHKRGDVKRYMRRVLNNPCFHTWVIMTGIWKRQRHTIELALCLQKHWRGEMGRMRAATARWLLERLKWISRGKRARIDMRGKVAAARKKIVDKEVQKLVSEGARRRGHGAGGGGAG